MTNLLKINRIIRGFNIVEHFLPSDSQDLLDIGCGTGNNTITNVTR